MKNLKIKFENWKTEMKDIRRRNEKPDVVKKELENIFLTEEYEILRKKGDSAERLRNLKKKAKELKSEVYFEGEYFETTSSGRSFDERRRAGYNCEGLFYVTKKSGIVYPDGKVVEPKESAKFIRITAGG